MNKIRNVALPVFSCTVFLLYLNGIQSWLYSQPELASRASSGGDILFRFLLDSIGHFLPASIIFGVILLCKIPLSQVGLPIKRTRGINIATLALVSVYITIIILRIKNGLVPTFFNFYIFFAHILGSAFAEELIFRGYLFASLDDVLGFKPAIYVSGALFAIPHITKIIYADSAATGYYELIWAAIVALFYTFAIASFLSFIFKKTKSIWIVSVIHAIVNIL